MIPLLLAPLTTGYAQQGYMQQLPSMPQQPCMPQQPQLPCMPQQPCQPQQPQLPCIPQQPQLPLPCQPQQPCQPQLPCQPQRPCQPQPISIYATAQSCEKAEDEEKIKELFPEKLEVYGRYSGQSCNVFSGYQTPKVIKHTYIKDTGV
ncbi:MAG: hypothetical protein MHMPM18_000213 [Marteilia pararefringens]